MLMRIKNSEEEISNAVRISLKHTQASSYAVTIMNDEDLCLRRILIFFVDRIPTLFLIIENVIELLIFCFIAINS